ncbi:MAG: LysR family transcriptional regulator [Rhodobacterales bacterium]|nr:MAG: LysR family transcriptional regulator [Rhodobacterales bacterium]
MPGIPHIRYLYVVNEVYRLGRISAAAEVVHLSQPAATQSLARVEEALGIALFERHPKGMVPTLAGTRFHPRLSRILNHFRQGDSMARKRAARGTSGRRGGTRALKTFHRFCSPVQLRALLAIETNGSFSQAAFELGVSQPGVHRAMRELASLAGFDLFEQTRGGVVLTSAAETFAHQVRLAISEFRQAVYEVNETLGQDVTTINVGSLPLSRATLLPIAIDALLGEIGAGVQVNCFDARYHTLLRDLRFGALDFIIGALRDPLPANDVSQEKLFTDQLAIVTAPGHPLVARDMVTLEDTVHYPWIAPPRETPSGTYLFDRLKLEDRPDTPVRIVSSSLVMMRALMAQGNYVSIASRRQIAGDLRAGTLARLPIDLPGSGRAIGLTFRTGWVPTPIQKRLLDILRDVAKSPQS